MSIILGLLILCLGIYFLGLFFQVARLEKSLTDGVTLLEKYMIVKYSLGDDKKTKSSVVVIEKGMAAVKIEPTP